jgi:hypothetical protein
LALGNTRSRFCIPAQRKRSFSGLTDIDKYDVKLYSITHALFRKTSNNLSFEKKDHTTVLEHSSFYRKGEFVLAVVSSLLQIFKLLIFERVLVYGRKFHKHLSIKVRVSKLMKY